MPPLDRSRRGPRTQFRCGTVIHGGRIHIGPHTPRDSKYWARRRAGSDRVRIGVTPCPLRRRQPPTTDARRQAGRLRGHSILGRLAPWPPPGCSIGGSRQDARSARGDIQSRLAHHQGRSVAAVLRCFLPCGLHFAISRLARFLLALLSTILTGHSNTRVRGTRIGKGRGRWSGSARVPSSGRQRKGFRLAVRSASA